MDESTLEFPEIESRVVTDEAILLHVSVELWT